MTTTKELEDLAAHYDTHDTSGEMEPGQWVDPQPMKDVEAAEANIPAPKFNVGDEVLYSGWTTTGTICSSHWVRGGWVYVATRPGMAPTEASETRFTKPGG
jgi:hypothetical protein